MDLVDLQTFVVVAEEGSFTLAGQKMGILKSTVSRRVQRLESSLGMELLRRKGRTFRLTEHGELLRSRCLPMLTELEDVGRLLLEQGELPTGLLMCKIPPALSGDRGFASLLSGFRRSHPNVVLHIEATARQIDLVEEGIDIEFRLHRGPLPDRASLMTRRLMHVQAWLVASPEYIQNRGTPESIDSLAAHDCLSPRLERPMNVWPLVHSGSGEKREVAIQAQVTSNELRLLHGVVKAGLGIGLLPEFLLKDDLAKGHLQRLLPEWSVHHGALSLVWPSTRYMALRVRAFIDYSALHFAPSTDDKSEPQADRP